MITFVLFKTDGVLSVACACLSGVDVASAGIVFSGISFRCLVETFSKTQRPKNLQGRRSVVVLTAVSVSRFGARIAFEKHMQVWFLRIYDTLRHSVRGHGRSSD